MSPNLVRSNTAKRVSELLESREGRKHLEENGWHKGMPVVIAEPAESFTDVMGLACVHDSPVLLVMLDPHTTELCLVHVSLPNAALNTVDAYPSGFTAQAFVEQVTKEGMLSFRVKYWNCTAVAHRLPEYVATLRDAQLSYRHS
ncbi:hypothetical protein [Glutamicibacter arilaitensis]|uniref:hypothetical protein n=1 Tax=Glutamicibacter arilaitensis TaxID=256701 RepID=UPI003A90ACB3